MPCVNERSCIILAYSFNVKMYAIPDPVAGALKSTRTLKLEF